MAFASVSLEPRVEPRRPETRPLLTPRSSSKAHKKTAPVSGEQRDMVHSRSPWSVAVLRMLGRVPPRQRVSLNERRLTIHHRIRTEALHLIATQVKVGVSLATTCNTGNQFRELGLLHMLTLDASQACFESDTSDPCSLFPREADRGAFQRRQLRGPNRAARTAFRSRHTDLIARVARTRSQVLPHPKRQGDGEPQSLILCPDTPDQFQARCNAPDFF